MDNSIVSIDNEKFLFLLNDLIAANWVSNVRPDLSDEILVDRFMEIHRVFLNRLGREQKGVLRGLPANELVKVVRGWIVLYKRALSLLRSQFPRFCHTRDMIIDDLNWSERLEISASGLLIIGHYSRYAEYWAERSIKTEDGYYSLNHRLEFIGSHAFNEYALMVRRGNFLVLDNFSNGVTSYDMMVFIKKCSCSPTSFLSEIAKMGWRMELGDENDIESIFQICGLVEDEHLYSRA